MKRIYLLNLGIILSIFLHQNTSAQIKDSIVSQQAKLTLSGFVDVFYTYDFNQPQEGFRQDFLFHHNRHNEFNLNLGLLKLAVEAPKYRANIALQAGVYANDNYAAEPGLLKNIFEANVGVALNKDNSLWLDMGILPSHLGFPSAISKENWTLTRSIQAESSPYFESGARLSYTSDNKKWFVSGLVLNGWQRIQRLEGNSLLSFGHQVTFTPSERFSLNSSSFIGTDSPDSTRQMRYFHNLYATIHLSKKVSLITAFDIGAQQKSKNSSEYNFWYSPTIITQYSPSEKVSLAARLEYYDDEQGVIIPTETQNGFKTWGYSINFDYHVTPQAVWRIEARGLSSKDDIFTTKEGTSNQNYFMTTSLAISF